MKNLVRARSVDKMRLRNKKVRLILLHQNVRSVNIKGKIILIIIVIDV